MAENQKKSNNNKKKLKIWRICNHLKGDIMITEYDHS